jgi:raffinose/stachyose/melibiose transport system substrate-binding protein
LQAINTVDGKLYGMSASAEMVGMFYNRSLFNQLNLSVPATWDDLEAAFDTIQVHNLIPISLSGNVSASVAAFNTLAYAYSDISDIHNLLQRNPGAAFLTEGNLDGAQVFVDWLDAGNFSPNFTRMDNDAALAEFANAKSVMWLASSDNSDALIGTMGSNLVGFFPLPSPIGDSVTPTVGGLGFAYGIRATSPNADLAAQYIDFITGSDGAHALLDNGILPASAVDPAKLTADTLSADLVNSWATITQAGKIASGFDWVLPDIGTRVQALVSRQIDPEAFVNAVEQDYETGR